MESNQTFAPLPILEDRGLVVFSPCPVHGASSDQQLSKLSPESGPAVVYPLLRPSGARGGATVPGGCGEVDVVCSGRDSACGTLGAGAGPLAPQWVPIV